jgi:hypothetical protein
MPFQHVGSIMSLDTLRRRSNLQPSTVIVRSSVVVSRPDANSALNIEAEVKEGLQGSVPSLTELRYRLRWSVGEYSRRDQSIEWH